LISDIDSISDSEIGPKSNTNQIQFLSDYQYIFSRNRNRFIL